MWSLSLSFSLPLSLSHHSPISCSLSFSVSLSLSPSSSLVVRIHPTAEWLLCLCVYAHRGSLSIWTPPSLCYFLTCSYSLCRQHVWMPQVAWFAIHIRNRVTEASTFLYFHNNAKNYEPNQMVRSFLDFCLVISFWIFIYSPVLWQNGWNPFT